VVGKMRVKVRSTLSSPRWSRPGCPELVAGSGKQVEVVVMVYQHTVSTVGHVVVVGSPYHNGVGSGCYVGFDIVRGGLGVGE